MKGWRGELKGGKGGGILDVQPLPALIRARALRVVLEYVVPFQHHLFLIHRPDPDREVEKTSKPVLTSSMEAASRRAV